MELLFIGLLIALLTTFTVKAFRTYQTFKGTIYPLVYSNFMEYYYKYAHKNNLSISRWLKHELGHHRIVFNSYLNDDKKILFEFMTIFHEKGVQIFSIISSKGNFRGKNNDKYWQLSRNDKNFRIQNPSLGIQQYKEHLLNLIDAPIPLDIAILFSKDSIFGQLKSDYSLAHYEDYITLLKAQENSLSKEEIENYFQCCIKR